MRDAAAAAVSSCLCAMLLDVCVLARSMRTVDCVLAADVHLVYGCVLSTARLGFVDVARTHCVVAYTCVLSSGDALSLDSPTSAASSSSSDI